MDVRCQSHIIVYTTAKKLEYDSQEGIFLSEKVNLQWGRQFRHRQQNGTSWQQDHQGTRQR